MRAKARGIAAALGLAVVAGGCAAPPGAAGPPPEAFRFPEDTFAYVNELVWSYSFDDEGKLLNVSRETPTEFGQRCTVMVRTARQFHVHARFAPQAPRLDDDAYAALIEQVMERDPRDKRGSDDPVVIPGFANLRDFSAAHPDLFKRTLGGPWRSYVQKGNWRMILPFLRGQQREMAEALLSGVRRGEPPIVHVVRFPAITINHTVLLFDARETPEEIVFAFYDPNQASHPLELRYDRALRTFHFPPTPYFGGGPVNVYEIYDGPLL